MKLSDLKKYIIRSYIQRGTKNRYHTHLGKSADFLWCKQVFDLPIYSKMSNNSSRQPSTNNFLMLQDKIETQKGENKILRQKLQSKSEALVILSQELDKVRNECEDYRELTRRYIYSGVQLSFDKTLLSL